MAEDLTGKKFHRLTVLGLSSTKRVGKKRPRIEYLWRCLCECGVERIQPSSHLTTGHTKSCGCWKVDKQRSKAPVDAQIHAAWLAHLRGASSRGHKNLLTKSEWFVLTQAPCFYCGMTNSNTKKPDPRNRWGEPFTYNGVDRQDNAADYTLVNSVSCCSSCNFMKWKFSTTDFLAQCRRVVDHADRNTNVRKPI